ncbi:hypothetical protein D3C87_1757240 [compost metagenome]
MPSSRVSSAAMASALASRCAAASLRIFARLPIGVVFQVPKAAEAAATAAAASRASEAACRLTMSRVSAGLRLSVVRPLALSHHSPSM